MGDKFFGYCKESAKNIFRTGRIIGAIYPGSTFWTPTVVRMEVESEGSIRGEYLPGLPSGVCCLISLFVTGGVAYNISRLSLENVAYLALVTNLSSGVYECIRTGVKKVKGESSWGRR